MGKVENTVAVNTKNENGTFDELVLDLFEREYAYSANLAEDELWERRGREQRGKHGREFEVDRATFDVIFNTAESAFPGGEFFIQTETPEERRREARRFRREQNMRELVPQARILRAIRGEVDGAKLSDLAYGAYRYEKGEYYDFEGMLQVIHAFLREEMSAEDFSAWLVLMMHCLQDATPAPKRLQREIYRQIADILDGAAFLSEDPIEQIKDCLELIARLKYCNHLLQFGHKKSFLENGVATYVSHFATVGDGYGPALSHVCIADEERGAVNFLYVPDLIYSEEINYTFVTEAEFGRLPGKYCDYDFDGGMSEEYAANKQKSE